MISAERWAEIRRSFSSAVPSPALPFHVLRQECAASRLVMNRSDKCPIDHDRESRRRAPGGLPSRGRNSSSIVKWAKRHRNWLRGLRFDDRVSELAFADALHGPLQHRAARPARGRAR
jgi:hypothetical protein